MLGNFKPVSLKSSGANLTIIPPALTPDENQLAYVFKVSGVWK
jgi:hypothetical protein